MGQVSAADWVATTAILRTLGRVEREFARITRTGPVRTTAQRDAAWADVDEQWAGWLARIHAVHAEIAEHHLVDQMVEVFTPEEIAEIISKAKPRR